MTTMTIAMRNAMERTSERQSAGLATASLSERNRAKLALLKRVLDDQLATALARGFHGTTVIEVAFQDGTIQHVVHKIEQLEK